MRSSLLRLQSSFLGVALALTASCVCPPKAAELLPLINDGTTRTPEQTFHTFRLAFQMDEADLEYRCLSRRLTGHYGLSALAYLEFRDALIEQEPFLRYGLSKAKTAETRQVAPRLAFVTSKVGGRELVLRLVREDFRERYEDGEWASGADLDDWHRWDAGGESTSTVLSTESGEHYLIPYFPLDSPEDAQGTSEIRMGSQWLIDGFLVDGVEIAPDALAP